MPLKDLVLVDPSSRLFLEGGGGMGVRMRAFPWHTHPLGNPEHWPVALRVAVRILLTTQHPLFIFWGPEYSCFYNDAYARSIGPEKHATMLGASGPDCWPEIWDLIGPKLDDVLRGGASTWHENQLIPIIRHGHLEDVYWTYSYSPIEDSASPAGVGGVLVICTETTAQMLTDRRHAFLVELDDAVRSHRDASTIVAAGIELLGRHLKASRVGFGIVQPDDATIVLETTYVDGVAPLGGAYPLSGFGPTNIRLQRQGVTVIHNDVADAPDIDLTRYEAIQTRAFVSVPLVRNARFRASLFVNAAAPRVWSKYEISLVESVAGRLFDAVERTRAEQELHLTARRFDLAVRRSPVVLFSQDLALRYTWIHNPAFGYRVEDFVGRRDVDVFPQRQDAELLEALKREVILSGESGRREVLVHGPDGSPRQYDLQIDPSFDEGGRIDGVLCSAVDITERKRAEASLRETDARKDVFLAVLSHELRSPLAPIQTAADLLASPELKPEQAQWARQVIQRQTKRMAQLLEDLLDIGRISQGKLTLRMERVTLAGIVDAAIEAARPAIDRKNHQLVISLPSNPLTLEVDTLRFSQVLVNLLTNAAKYTDAGGRIELSAVVEGPRVCVSVKDDGIGIEPMALPRIFDIFSQIDSAAGRSEGGLGIGLALVRGIVELHGGTVEAHSLGIGAGSTFLVYLPL